MDQDLLCAVCQDVITKEIETECNHRFCVKCLFKWVFQCVEYYDFINCPLCRQEIWINRLVWSEVSTETSNEVTQDS